MIQDQKKAAFINKHFFQKSKQLDMYSIYKIKIEHAIIQIIFNTVEFIPDITYHTLGFLLATTA